MATEDDGAARAFPGLIPGMRYRLWFSAEEFDSQRPVVGAFDAYAGDVLWFTEATYVYDEGGCRNVLTRLGEIGIPAGQVRMLAEDLPPTRAK